MAGWPNVYVVVHAPRVAVRATPSTTGEVIDVRSVGDEALTVSDVDHAGWVRLAGPAERWMLVAMDVGTASGRGKRLLQPAHPLVSPLRVMVKAPLVKPSVPVEDPRHANIASSSLRDTSLGVGLRPGVALEPIRAFPVRLADADGSDEREARSTLIRNTKIIVPLTNVAVGLCRSLATLTLTSLATLNSMAAH